MTSTFRCGSCGSELLVIRPEWVPELEWSVRCSNGHPLLPVEGVEYVVGQTEVDPFGDDSTAQLDAQDHAGHR